MARMRRILRKHRSHDSSSFPRRLSSLPPYPSVWRRLRPTLTNGAFFHRRLRGVTAEGTTRWLPGRGMLLNLSPYPPGGATEPASEDERDVGFGPPALLGGGNAFWKPFPELAVTGDELGEGKRRRKGSKGIALRKHQIQGFRCAVTARGGSGGEDHGLHQKGWNKCRGKHRCRWHDQTLARVRSQPWAIRIVLLPIAG